MPLFHHFYPKIDTNAPLNSVFSNFGWFNKKTVKTIQFSITKIKIWIFFMDLRSKLISEMCPKIGDLDGKTEQNCLKMTTLPTLKKK